MLGNNMLEIEYTATAQETSKATLDFMSNRPIMALLFLSMKISCLLLCLVFTITLYNKSIRPQDIGAILFAVIWLLYYKQINRWIIRRSLKMRKFTDYKCLYKIDDKSILYQLHTFAPQHIQWKKLKYVLKNNEGYIIPITGIDNAGKFLWLPFRSLHNDSDQQQFLNFLEKFKLKLKEIKS